MNGEASHAKYNRMHKVVREARREIEAEKRERPATEV